jgi:GNAT superfamily N-acetyltransferase
MVTVDETLDVQPVAKSLTTISGARIEPITVYAAKSFLKRLDQMDHTPAVVDAAWGAFADATLIGVSVLALSRSRKGRAFVGVVRDWRRLGVGTDLLGLLVAEAVARDLTTLTCVHAASDPGPRHLARAFGLTTARRVCAKTAVMVVILAKPLPKRTELINE